MVQSVVVKEVGISDRRGSALLGTCDRSGFTELFTPAGRSVILPTTCKTWGCVICRRKLLALFRARVEVGVSHLGPCAFMTITYQADTERLKDARCVAKDWQALWRSLRRRGHRWPWLKVTELTKRKIPHHHVTVGPVTQEIRCHGRSIKRGRETARYLSRMDSCLCLAHTFAREWWGVTGDSYICFATPVDNAVGAASYMAKYMEKAFLGPVKGRRFSTSRDWPGGERMRLKVTKEHGWSHIRRWPGASFDSTIDLNPREADLLERVGDDLTKVIVARNARAKARKEHRKWKGAWNDDSSKRREVLSGANRER